MIKSLLIYTLAAGTLLFTACLKSNPYAEDFSSTQPIADLPKAPANAVTVATAPTNSWVLLDSTAAGADYATAVHISAKNHLGDITLHMKIDKDAAFDMDYKITCAKYSCILDCYIKRWNSIQGIRKKTEAGG